MQSVSAGSCQCIKCMCLMAAKGAKNVVFIMALMALSVSSYGQNNAMGHGDASEQTRGYKNFKSTGEKYRIRKDTKHSDVYAVSENGEIIETDELVRLEKLDRDYYRKQLGCIQPSFREKLDQKKDDELLEVLVTFRHEEIRKYDKTKHTPEYLAELSRNHQKKPKTQISTERILQRYHLLDAKTRQPLPAVESGQVAVRCLATRSALEKMAFDDDIASISEFVEPEPCVADYMSCVYSAYQPDMTARGCVQLHSATSERGLSDEFLQCIGMWPRPDGVDVVNPPTPYSGPWTPEHCEATFNFFRMTTPDTTHYHCNEFYFVAEDWIINYGIRTASRSTSSIGDALDYVHRFMDEFSFRYPQPLFCNPTGNSGFDLTSSWQSYNGLDVGNVRHWYEKFYFIFGSTQTKNPDDRYGSWFNDREMPYIVAPGAPPETNGVVSTECSMSIGNTGGTSMSAPIVNGISANVISADYDFLKDWPEAVRAIILATARNVEYGEWNQFEDQKDGTGVIC